MYSSLLLSNPLCSSQFVSTLLISYTQLFHCLTSLLPFLSPFLLISFHLLSFTFISSCLIRAKLPLNFFPLLSCFLFCPVSSPFLSSSPLRSLSFLLISPLYSSLLVSSYLLRSYPVLWDSAVHSQQFLCCTLNESMPAKCICYIAVMEEMKNKATQVHR